MQVANIERNQPQFLMSSRTSECRESAGAGKKEWGGRELPVPMIHFPGGNKGAYFERCQCL